MFPLSGIFFRKHSQQQRGKPRVHITLLPKATSVVAIVGKRITNRVINAQPSKANVPLAKKWDTGRHVGVMLSSKTTNRYNKSNIGDDSDPCARRYRKQTTPPGSAH